MNKEDEKAVRQFIERAPLPPLMPVEWIVDEVRLLRLNTENHLQRTAKSTTQRRDQRTELERLLGILESLHLDTRELLGMEISRGIARARHPGAGWECSCDIRDFDGLVLAVKSGIRGARSSGERGEGRMARVRRKFVIDAAYLFIMSGFRVIGDSEESRFTAWLDLMQRVAAVPKFSVKYGGLRRAIRDAIGDTSEARKAWSAKHAAYIQRWFPSRKPYTFDAKNKHQLCLGKRGCTPYIASHRTH